MIYCTGHESCTFWSHFARDCRQLRTRNPNKISDNDAKAMNRLSICALHIGTLSSTLTWAELSAKGWTQPCKGALTGSWQIIIHFGSPDGVVAVGLPHA